MITSYNKKRNNPVYQHHHPFYHPLNIVPNEAILASEASVVSSINKSFLDPKTDQSAKKNIIQS